MFIFWFLVQELDFIEKSRVDMFDKKMVVVIFTSLRNLPFCPLQIHRLRLKNFDQFFLIDLYLFFEITAFFESRFISFYVLDRQN